MNGADHAGRRCSELPAGSLSTSGCAISVNSSLANSAQGMNEQQQRQHRLHEPVAQLEQVRHQRAFGELLLRLLRRLRGHARLSVLPLGSGGVVRSSSRLRAVGRRVGGAALGRGRGIVPRRVARSACGDRVDRTLRLPRPSAVRAALPASARGRAARASASSEVSMPGSMFTLVSRLCASSSSCSRNWRAMARARPTQRPTCCASFGSFSRPEHDQRDREDQQQFGESNLEHGNAPPRGGSGMAKRVDVAP